MASLFNRCSGPWKARLVRLGFNLHPAYRGTGGRVEYVSPDMTLIRVRVPLVRRTRNLVGSIFGGTLFAITDGPHPLMLMMGLGRDYIVWDKSASIQYKKPGKGTLYADFIISAQELVDVRNILTGQPELDRTYRVELKDSEGVVHSIVDRTVYIANKNYYKQKISDRKAA